MRTVRNASISLSATTSTVISEEKMAGKRVVLEISSMEAVGGNDVFVSVGEEAGASKGRRIQPGQTITWSTDGGYIPPQLRVNAYSAGTPTLTIYEEIEG